VTDVEKMREAFTQAVIYHSRSGANSCRECGDMGVEWLGRLFPDHQYDVFLENLAALPDTGTVAALDEVERRVTTEWRGGTGHTDNNKWVNLADLRRIVREVRDRHAGQGTDHHD
jgi:succinate dehydrogenase/fumarate reductase flavoprotein subunit